MLKTKEETKIQRRKRSLGLLVNGLLVKFRNTLSFRNVDLASRLLVILFCVLKSP